MTSPAVHGAGAGESSLPRFPPITALCVTSMGLVIAAGIVIAAHLPRVPPLGAPTGLVLAGVAAFLVAAVMTARLRGFAWGRFFQVVRWVLLAYVVIGGMLAYVFVDDHTRGGALALMIASLAVFAVNVPLILAFTVARYESPSEPSGVAAS